jgi:hypothetical protein
MVSLFAPMPITTNASASVTHNGNLAKRICTAAEDYNNRYYSVIAAHVGHPQLREYTKWMDNILSYQQSSPEAVFLPKDMFDDISNRLGLSTLPLNTFRCLDFLLGLKIKAYRSLTRYIKSQPGAIGKLLLCCPSDCLLEGADHQKILRSGAIMKATDDGMLMLPFGD